MQRVFVLSSILLLASFTDAHAAAINLGFISFDTLIPSDGEATGVNVFSIGNLTGDPGSGGFALPEDFPVFTPIVFANSTMTVVEHGSSTNYLLGDLGPGFAQPDLLRFLASAQISSATFSAQIGPLAFTLADGSIFAANSSLVTATLMPSAGLYLSAGLDVALLTIDATPQTTVPEPQTWLLLASGLATLAQCRRRTRARS